MTDPIAVDVPAKPSYSRSVPLGVTGLPPAPSPTPTPAPKVEPPKPLTTAVVTAAAAAVGVPPVPGAAPAAAGFLARFTKKQLVVGATAALSLFAGVSAVRMLFPAKDDPGPVAAVTDKVALSPPAPPAAEKAAPKAPAVEVIPSPSSEPLTPPPLPTTPVASARPTGIQPITPEPPRFAAPPTITPDPRFASAPSALPALPTPDFGPSPVPLPALPSPSGVMPIGASEPAKGPAAPPTPALPPLPAAPAAGGALPPLPAVPAPKVEPLTPPSGIAPVVPPPPSGVAPKVPDPGGLVPLPTPGTVAPKLPDPTISPLPAPGGVVPPAVTPPAPPAPSVFPVPMEPAPKLEVKPPQPDLRPPAFDPPGVGTTGFTKPAGGADAKPATPVFAPKTTFDVDIYNPTDKDSYETISLEFYNDKRFAAALKAFNQNKPLQGGAYVNVPPIHVLKRQFPNAGGAAVPVGATGGPDWGAAPARPAANARNAFVVPQGGMTLEEVARHTMGSGQRWRDIYDLNPQVTNTAAVVPAGTELKLPPDARVP